MADQTPNVRASLDRLLGHLDETLPDQTEEVENAPAHRYRDTDGDVWEWIGLYALVEWANGEPAGLEVMSPNWDTLQRQYGPLTSITEAEGADAVEEQAAPAPCVGMLWNGRPDGPSIYCADDNGHPGEHHATVGSASVRWSEEADRG